MNPDSSGSRLTSWFAMQFPDERGRGGGPSTGPRAAVLALLVGDHDVGVRGAFAVAIEVDVVLEAGEPLRQPAVVEGEAAVDVLEVLSACSNTQASMARSSNTPSNHNQNSTCSETRTPSTLTQPVYRAGRLWCASARVRPRLRIRRGSSSRFGAIDL
jgi:hypothetical protein